MTYNVFGGTLSLTQSIIQYISPPSVSNSGTRNACSFDRTWMNFWKSATLLRVRNSSSLSLRSRGCPMFIRCSRCGHVIHPTVASSVTKETSATIRSSSWTPLIASVRIRVSSKGRTSPYSAPISAVQTHLINKFYFSALTGPISYLPNLCIGLQEYIICVRSFSKMLAYVKFAEDKALIFTALHRMQTWSSDVHKSLPFFKHDESQFTFSFKHAIRVIYFVSNDVFNNLLVNFDNLCKTHLRLSQNKYSNVVWAWLQRKGNSKCVVAYPLNNSVWRRKFVSPSMK